MPGFPFPNAAIPGYVGTEYFLFTYGWVPGADIGPAFQSAVTAAASTPGGGIVTLPAGFLHCDRAIVVPPGSNFPDFNAGSITIRGAGMGATYIAFGNSDGIVLAGNNSQNFFAGGIKDLQVHGSTNPGYSGIRLQNCVGTGIENVLVGEWGSNGISMESIGSGVCQNITFYNVACTTSVCGLFIQQCNHWTATHLILNQNFNFQARIQVVLAGSIHGMMLQGGGNPNGSGCPFSLEPRSGGSIQLGITGPIYVEESGNQPVIVAARAVDNNTDSGYLSIFGSFALFGSKTFPLLDLQYMSYVQTGPIRGAGYATFYKFRNMRAVTLTNVAAGPSNFDTDSPSTAVTTQIDFGVLTIGGVAVTVP